MIKVKFTNLGVSRNGPKTGYTLSIHGHVVGKMRVTNMFDMFRTTGFLEFSRIPLDRFVNEPGLRTPLGRCPLASDKEKLMFSACAENHGGLGQTGHFPTVAGVPNYPLYFLPTGWKTFQQPKYINICQTSILTKHLVNITNGTILQICQVSRWWFQPPNIFSRHLRWSPSVM